MSDSAELDIRWPIGLLFAVMGAALAVFGVFDSKIGTARTLGINLNLWWGLVMLVFGLGMTFGAWCGSRRDS